VPHYQIFIYRSFQIVAMTFIDLQMTNGKKVIKPHSLLFRIWNRRNFLRVIFIIMSVCNCIIIRNIDMFIFLLSCEITWHIVCAHRLLLRIYTSSSIQCTTMAATQRTTPEFKLVLVGDGGVGMFDYSFVNFCMCNSYFFR
jgi:hypothetical protein